MFKALTTKCWEAFLTSRGFHHNRTKGSHHMWVRPGYRSIPVWENEKEIPAFHLKTGCKTIGCTPDDLYSWVALNCKL